MRIQRKQSTPYYAYCVLRLDAEQSWAVFPGVGERPVFPVREGKLAMAVSRLDDRFTTDAHSIIQHGRVVHRLFDRHTVLPFRFGTTFKNETQIRQVLLANRSDFLEALNRLRGKAEMHVKLLFAGGGGSGGGAQAQGEEAGSEFLRHASELLAGRFQPVEEQVSVRPLQNGEWLVDFAHLIDEARVPSYQRVYTGAAEQIKDCQLLLSGPWPPYHFLPSGIRMPAASEANLYGGRRMTKRPAPPVLVRAAKA